MTSTSLLRAAKRTSAASMRQFMPACSAKFGWLIAGKLLAQAVPGNVVYVSHGLYEMHDRTPFWTDERIEPGRSRALCVVRKERK